MISFQRLLGRQDKFFGLLTASAQECANSVAALARAVAHPGVKPYMKDFVEARRKDKQITNELEELLIKTFVTPIEREDIEALAEQLYRIPKTVEKFAERYNLVAEKVADVDFKPQVGLLQRAMSHVLTLVRSLQNADLPAIRQAQTDIQFCESEADDLLTEALKPLYAPGFPPLKAIILKDLFDLVEEAIDRCRDVGTVASHVLLKNS